MSEALLSMLAVRLGDDDAGDQRDGALGLRLGDGEDERAAAFLTKRGLGALRKLSGEMESRRAQHTKP